MENDLDSTRTIDAEKTIEYELSQTKLRAMEPATETVANGTDDGASQTRSAVTLPDHEVQFRSQASTSAARRWQPMTGTDIDDYRTTTGMATHAADD